MSFWTFQLFCSVLFGLAFGSFMNVCIYRIPLRKSIIHPPSSCPNCGTRIRFYDNIPLLSFIILGGRCRSCRTPLAWHYPVVEALGGLLSLSLFIRYGLSFQFFLLLIFTASLVTISFIDLHHQIIPDLISLPGIAVGFLSNTGLYLFQFRDTPLFSAPYGLWGRGSGIFLLGQVTWLDSLLGAAIGGGALYLVALVFQKLTGKQGMGGGDIKLLAMIGAWLGWRSLLLVVMIASVTGTLLGVTALLLSGKGLRRRIPFGPFLSMGALAYCFFGHPLKDWYLGLFT